MKIIFSKTFRKYYQKSPAKIRKAFEKRLLLFLKDPFYSQLHNHALSGNLQGYRSINITGDWRSLFTEVRKSGDILVTFEAIGTHSQLYR